MHGFTDYLELHRKATPLLVWMRRVPAIVVTRLAAERARNRANLIVSLQNAFVEKLAEQGIPAELLRLSHPPVTRI